MRRHLYNSTALLGSLLFMSVPSYSYRPLWRKVSTSRVSKLSVISDISAGDARINAKDDDDMTVIEPLVVCGPSGVGKGTIISKFMDVLKGSEHFAFSVSHTTRKPRVGEINGVHYHFVGLEEMKRQIEIGSFLEHAEVHGNLYGTSISSLRDVQRTGKKCLLDIDLQGAAKIKSFETSLFKPKSIFIVPPSLEILEERLRDRGTESDESFQRRTKNAKRELEEGMQEGKFDAIVINDDLDRACEDFLAAVKQLYNTPMRP